MVKGDARFDKVLTDPRFKKISRKEKKVKIDARFQHMFTDEQFQQTYSVDKRGRPLQEKQGEDLEKFYELESDEEEEAATVGDEEAREEKVKTKEVKSEGKTEKKKKKEKEGVEINTEDSKGKKPKEKEKVKQKVKKKQPPPVPLAEVSSSDDDDDVEGSSKGPAKKAVSFDDIRGKNIAHDASSSDEDESDLGDGYIDRKEVGIEFEEGLVHGWGELDADARRIEDAETARLAFCNCDWDKITATDIFVLCSSFKPPTGNINSVTIYPSDFGLERMREEDVRGPLLPSEGEEEEQEDGGKSKGEGSEYHMEKLREYQLARLKYFYAVVECDSKDTADTLYSECDGMEYEMSATRLDIRFIPEETTFEDREPHSVCTEMPGVQTYQPTTFLNTALQQSTVRLTWDETDHKRQELTSKSYSKKDIDEIDFKEYIASSSSESEGEDDKVDKYKALMDLVRSNNKEEEGGSEEEGDMEVTFEPGMTFAGEDEQEGSKKKKGFVVTNKESTKDSKKNGKKKSEQSSGEESGLSDEEEDSSEAGETGEAMAAFSNDEEAPSGFDDPFFKTGEDTNDKTKKKKKKKKKTEVNEEDLTEEEKKQKKELELLLMQGETDDSRKHFSLKSIVENEKRLANKGNKRKKRKNEDKVIEDDFEMDVKDERFAAIYDQHAFALDPSQHHFKRTKATDALFEESQRRKQEKKQILDPETTAESVTATNDTTSTETSLSSLVKSVKAKAKSHHINKKKKPKVT